MIDITSKDEDGGSREGPQPSKFSDHASRLIFGSCNSQHYEQPFWKIIGERNPAAFVWTGDSVYADDRPKQSVGGRELHSGNLDSASWWWPSLSRVRSRSPGYADATPDYLRELYRQQLEVPEYRDLITGGGISIFGALDDHDYGTNNGDKTFPFRTQSGIEFTRFLGLDDRSSAMARRASRGAGVYGVQVYDFSSAKGRLLSDADAGLDPDVIPDATYRDRRNDSGDNNGGSSSNNSDKLVAVFVLDVRSNKTPWAKGFPERYALNPEGDFLGEDQWKWFETAIGRSNARVNIIVSGIQVHAPWFYDSNKIENWSGFPAAQHRLYQTVLQPNVRAPILFSGDIHMAQILRKDCRRMASGTDLGNEGDSGKGGSQRHRTLRPLYEVTSSGMTHSWSSNSGRCGRPKNSRLCSFYPFNVLVEIVMTYAHYASPWTALLRGNDDDRGDGSRGAGGGSRERRAGAQQRQYTLERNIAEVEVDWEESVVTVRILGDRGQTLLRQDWSMDRLTGGGEPWIPGAGSLLGDPSFEEGQKRLESSLRRGFPSDHGEYICVNYRGNIDRVHFAFSVVSTIGVFVAIGTYPFLLCLGILARWVLRRHGKASPPVRRRREAGTGKSTSGKADRPKTD